MLVEKNFGGIFNRLNNQVGGNSHNLEAIIGQEPLLLGSVVYTTNGLKSLY
jgi:hypothetical protein